MGLLTKPASGAARLPQSESTSDFESGSGSRTSRPTIRRRIAALRQPAHPLWSLLFLAILTVVVWARPVLGDFTTKRLANPGDSSSFEFYLGWNLHVLTDPQDPFFTPNLYAPTGMDLGNAISIPAVSLLVAPVTATAGVTAAYNVAFLLAILFTAFSVWLLARELTGSTAGALLAASLVTMSPYFSGHALGHLNMMWIWALPFVCYVAARAVKGTISTIRIVVYVALALAFTMGASTELALTQIGFAVVALLVALVFLAAPTRKALLRAVPVLAVGGLAGLLLSAPVIWAGLRGGVPDDPVNPAAEYSIDLANIFFPTDMMRFGESWFLPLVGKLNGNSAENTAYIPAVLLIFLLAYCLASRSRLAAALVTFAAVTTILGFGPVLNIAGTPTAPLPWTLTQDIPALDHVLPVRFSAFSFMAIALMVAHAFASRIVPRWYTVGTVALAMVLLVPSLEKVMPVDTTSPEFVSSGEAARAVGDDANVLIVPAGQFGPGMHWIAELDYSIRMPTGNGGGAKTPAALYDPVGASLYFGDLGFDYRNQLPPFLERNDIDAVLAPVAEPQWVSAMTKALGAPTSVAGGVAYWDVSR